MSFGTSSTSPGSGGNDAVGDAARESGGICNTRSIGTSASRRVAAKGDTRDMKALPAGRGLDKEDSAAVQAAIPQSQQSTMDRLGHACVRKQVDILRCANHLVRSKRQTA